jgi:hypothetical protein
MELEFVIDQLKAETLFEQDAAAALGIDDAVAKNLAAASADVIEEALEILSDGGDVSDEVMSALSAYTAEHGDAADTTEVEELIGPIANFLDPEYVLDGIPNEDAAKANEAVAALKLPRSELTNLVPNVSGRWPSGGGAAVAACGPVRCTAAAGPQSRPAPGPTRPPPLPLHPLRTGTPRPSSGLAIGGQRRSPCPSTS